MVVVVAESFYALQVSMRVQLSRQTCIIPEWTGFRSSTCYTMVSCRFKLQRIERRATHTAESRWHIVEEREQGAASREQRADSRQ
jgi:hypothetical protein